MLSTIFSAASILGVIADITLNIRSNKIARETAKRELRAYVSVQPVTLAFFQGDKVLEVAIKMHNGGSTPAYDCIHAGNVVILDQAKAKAEFTHKNERIQHGTRAPLVLHAGQEIAGAITAPIKFTDAQIGDVRSGDLAIYAFGFAEYRDTFGKTRRTSFCYSVSGPTFRMGEGKQKEGVPVPMLWHLEPFHNDAT